METAQKTTASGAADTPSAAQLAKATFRRLALAKLEPTPENYARAYALEKGGTKPAALPEAALPLVRRLAERAFAADSQSRALGISQALCEGHWERAQSLMGVPDERAHEWAGLVERVVRGLELGGKTWTPARKKNSLQRVLDSSRSDLQRLMHRLQQLLSNWESDTPASTVETLEDDAAGLPAGADAPGQAPPGTRQLAPAAIAKAPVVAGPGGADAGWLAMLETMSTALRGSLPEAEPQSREFGKRVAEVVRKIAAQGATADLAGELAHATADAQRALQHRQHLVEQLGRLCSELTASMAELAESDSWASGQCEVMHNTLKDGITARGVKAVNELLRQTRARQGELRGEREQAKRALKELIGSMLGELGELGSQTGKFQENVGRYTDVIERAESLEELTIVVSDLVAESRAVHGQVAQAQARLQEEHTEASSLSRRVDELENELQRLAEEVTTDQLTQVANRRGLIKVFEVERARMERNGSSLSIGLLDIDNFKRLNDEHGHAKGDQALKALAERVSKTLRATDLVARYGGEEFVVLLPDTKVPEAQDTLTRLQRSLSGGLFLNEGKNLLVTFSAGVSACRSGERIEDVLERADQALYEAKRSGKNRTCVA